MKVADNVIGIFVASSHREYRVNRVAPTGYAFALSTELDRPRWGFGGAREAQEMLAHGLNRAAELALIEDDQCRIEVIVRTTGFKKYLTEFVPSWLAKMASDPGFSRNNIQAWERLHNLYLLGQVSIRLPTDSEVKTVEAMQVLARDAALKALAQFQQAGVKYRQAGVYVTDEDASVARAS